MLTLCAASPTQILPLSPSTRSLQHQEQNAGAAPQDAGDKEVVFMAHLEPLAFGEYIVRPVEAGHPHAAVESQVRALPTVSRLAVSNWLRHPRIPHRISYEHLSTLNCNDAYALRHGVLCLHGVPCSSWTCNCNIEPANTVLHVLSVALSTILCRALWPGAKRDSWCGRRPPGHL